MNTIEMYEIDRMGRTLYRSRLLVFSILFLATPSYPGTAPSHADGSGNTQTKVQTSHSSPVADNNRAGAASSTAARPSAQEVGAHTSPQVPGQAIPTEDVASLETEREDPRKALYRAFSTERENVSFEEAFNSRRDWTGVVFGSEISAEGTLEAPRHAEFRPYDNERSKGQVVVTFENQTTGVFRSIAAEDWFIARKVATRGSASDNDTPSSRRHGHAFGLQGLTNRVDIRACGICQHEFAVKLWFQVVLHPALLDTKLGWSMIMVDAYPVMRTKSLRALMQGKDGSGVSAWGTLLGQGAWKVLDRPMLIRRKDDDDELVITVTDEHNQDVFLRVRAFLDDHDDNESDEEQAVSKEFLEGITSLKESTDDLGRLNDFARTFGLVRWLVQNGARLSGGELPDDAGRTTPDSVFISAGDLRPSPVSQREFQVSNTRLELSLGLTKSGAELLESISKKSTNGRTTRELQSLVESRTNRILELVESLKDTHYGIDEGVAQILSRIEGEGHVALKDRIKLLQEFDEARKRFGKALRDEIWNKAMDDEIALSKVLLPCQEGEKRGKPITDPVNPTGEAQGSSNGEKATAVKKPEYPPAYLSWRTCRAGIQDFETIEAKRALGDAGERIFDVLSGGENRTLR